MVKYVDFMYIFKKKGTSLEGICTGNIPPCKNKTSFEKSPTLSNPCKNSHVRILVMM